MTDRVRFGFSSYSFHTKLSTGEMTLAEVIDWVAASEGEHLELAILSDDGPEGSTPGIGSDPAYVASVRRKAADAGVRLSSLAVGADLTSADPTEHAAQVARVKQYVDLAESLGIRQMRHDVAPHPPVSGDDTVAFESVLPRIVDGARQIARYAAERGITTSLENHGFFVQSADRVRRIIHAVDQPNFRTTLDVGNFVCVDEDPVASVTANLPHAMVVHLKDFYIRPAKAPIGSGPDMGEGWMTSRGGKQLRGAVVGNGDLDLPGILTAIKASDYTGDVAIEFEGWEDCLLGCERGLATARRLLDAA
jgi:sugar phosphate isomerase/epimerase